jgi:hypothetical protein
LKGVAIFVAVLGGGFLLGEIAYEINIRQTSALESAPTAQHSTPAHQPVSEIGRTGASGSEAPPVATVQEAQPTNAPATGPANIGSGASHKRQRK